MYYVYILRNESDQSLYIGFTSDLKRRVEEHHKGEGGRTTKIKKGWKLIYYEAYIEKSDALGREKFLKGGSGRKYINKQLKNYFETT
ncbi:MAG: GIY-YIG nuclease family protein [Nanoarchaeota archaeon]|nr:GIY-YIG nuclease family protein [Nanoarchaeota archaeon]